MPLIKVEKKKKNIFGQPNEKNLNTMNMLSKYSPKYAKHAFYIDNIVTKFAKEKFGGIEILELPMCNKCERPGLWHEGGTCECPKCGNTGKAKSMRERFAEDLKEFGLNVNKLQALDNILPEEQEELPIILKERIDEDENQF